MLFGGGAAAVALLIPWLPDPASKQAHRIDFVFWFVTTISIAIFALVAAVIVYSLLKFRARADDDSDGPPVHGHTGLEIWWTAVPAALVTAISILSAVVLAKNEQLPNAPSASAARAAATSTQSPCRRTSADPLKPLVVCVIAQQFAWLFQYPAYNNATSATLRLPIDTTVQLQLQSKDVIHSFWVPEFGQKQDAVPGLLTKLVITPDRLGTFPVICTELCGLGHALMRSETTVEPKDKFLAWARARGKGGAAGGGLSASAKTFFVDNGCDGCHTFKPAGSNGTVGPDLDNLREAAQKAGQPLEQFIRQSIVDPNAYVAPGYPKGVMPETFSSLPKQQLDALVNYLSGGSQ
jgi:cytochrome c oxidase subunit II